MLSSVNLKRKTTLDIVQGVKSAVFQLGLTANPNMFDSYLESLSFSFSPF